MTRRSRKPGRLQSLAARIKRELAFCACVLRHPDTPRPARWLLAAAIAYLCSPVDLIPDWIPVLGHLDDVLIVPGLIFLAVRLVPAHVKAECRVRRDSDTPDAWERETRQGP